MAAARKPTATQPPAVSGPEPGGPAPTADETLAILVLPEGATEEQAKALVLLHHLYRLPPAEYIAKLTKTWTDRSGTEKSFTLDYMGHADVTDAILRADPFWNWEPVAWNEQGMPRCIFTDNGHPIGLWIRLTIHGVTRLGFGTCPPGKGVEGVKELIGDALRNAAMRFGIGVGLWSKSEWKDIEIAGDIVVTSPAIGAGGAIPPQRPTPPERPPTPPPPAPEPAPAPTPRPEPPAPETPPTPARAPGSVSRPEDRAKAAALKEAQEKVEAELMASFNADPDPDLEATGRGEDPDYLEEPPVDEPDGSAEDTSVDEGQDLDSPVDNETAVDVAVAMSTLDSPQAKAFLQWRRAHNVPAHAPSMTWRQAYDCLEFIEQLNAGGA